LRHKAQLILRLELATSTEEHPAMLKILGNTNFADLWGLVLAAGDGKRLEKFIHQTLGNKLPKQYVNFVGRRSMLEHTIRRAQKLIPENRIVTIVSRDHLKYAEVRRQLSPYADQNVIVQPVNRETGPGVLLPLMHIYKRSPEAVVAVFPSDHFIWEENRFMDYVDLAVQKVTGHPSEIVLLGVEAENAEPEYGYIIPQRDVLFDLHGTRRIARFIEKPSAAIAPSLIESGGLWNTMIMVFKVKTLLQLVQRIHPAMYAQFHRVYESIETPAVSVMVDRVYRELEPLNFSKDIVEKVAVIFPETISVLPVLQVFWSDWGSPERIKQVQQKLQLNRRRAGDLREAPLGEPASDELRIA
jgi:mannose-1-phosphate guanylyltransferase